MPVMIVRNQPAASECANCKETCVVIGWTHMDNSDGMGYQTHTLRLCRSCMLEQAAALNGRELADVYVARLKAADVQVPRGATLDALRDLCRLHDLRLDTPDAEDGSEGEPVVRPNTLKWWGLEAEKAGVPLIEGLSIKQITARMGIWAQAKELGIDLYEAMTNEQALGAVHDAQVARGGGAPRQSEGATPAEAKVAPDGSLMGTVTPG